MACSREPPSSPLICTALANSLPSGFRSACTNCRCALAAVAQFYPKKYPDNFWVLLVCVGLYMAATLALNIMFSGTEGDVFYIAKDKMVRPT